MFWNQLGLTPEELCSVSWGIFMRCHMHIHTSINNICIRILCRCNWAQYGHQDFQSATGGLMCHSGCQWCIPKNHYKLLCHFLGLILKTQWDLLKNHYKHLRGFFRVSWRPLVRSFGFCSNPLSRLGLHFCSDFFWPVHGKCSDWGWAELLYSYKILTQQPSPNTNPDPFSTFNPRCGDM